MLFGMWMVVVKRVLMTIELERFLHFSSFYLFDYF